MKVDRMNLKKWECVIRKTKKRTGKVNEFPIAPGQLTLKSTIKLSSWPLLSMKFCKRYLNPVELYLWGIERYIRGRQAWFWQLKPYFNSFRLIWRTYGWQVTSRKIVAKSLAACDSRRLYEENQLRFSNSKHFRFYWKKKHFISEWYFTRNPEIRSLVVQWKQWKSEHRGTRTICDSCRFDSMIGRFRAEPTDLRKVSTCE